MLMQLLAEFWKVLEQSAIFILLGFVFAAGLHVVMSRTRWANWLQAMNTKSVLLAAAIAAPLPLCSCSVIPAAISLRKRGASKGAVLSFLISAPETNVESITFTWGLLGPVFAIFRPIAGLITAFTAGIAENFFERRYPSPPASGSESPVDAAPAAPSCCGAVPVAVQTCCAGEGNTTAAADAHSCCAQTDVLGHVQRVSWRDGMRHAFVEVFDSVVGWMLFGVAAAAIINVLIPGYVIDAVFGPPLQAMLVMLAIGIPLYVCAEASTPIAAALILQGVNPGAALVFLLAGPATNIGSIMVLARHLGRRTIVVYLVSIAVVAVAMGLILDWLFVIGNVKIEEHVMSTPLVSSGVKTAGAVLFVALAAFSAVRQRYDRRLAAILDGFSPVRVTPSRLIGGMTLAAVVAYVLSGFVVIEPGQLGMIKRFGRMVHAEAPPGLHWAGPYPVGSVDRIDTRQVFRLELGPGAGVTVSADTEDDRAWVLLGDENIANIKCAAHWRMAPGAVRAFAYGTADREKLVACAVRSALRKVLGGANIDTVFTTEQIALAEEIHADAQRILDQNAGGIELVGFHFLDLHAPPQVHEAFRDVASALEDRATRRNQALARQAEIEPLALGTRDKLIGAAQADALRISAEAAGEGDAFLETLAAYREFPDLTRMRAVFEMYDRILPGRRKFIRPTAPNLQLDLRFGGDRKEGEGTP